MKGFFVTSYSWPSDPSVLRKTSRETLSQLGRTCFPAPSRYGVSWRRCASWYPAPKHRRRDMCLSSHRIKQHYSCNFQPRLNASIYFSISFLPRPNTRKPRRDPRNTEHGGGTRPEPQRTQGEVQSLAKKGIQDASVYARWFMFMCCLVFFFNQIPDLGFEQRSQYHQPDLWHEEVVELSSPFASVVMSETKFVTRKLTPP